MNKNRLEAEMKLHGDTAAELAKYIGISACSFSYKKNEKHGLEFTKGEIAKIKERYKLSAEEVDRIFFADEVS